MGVATSLLLHMGTTEQTVKATSMNIFLLLRRLNGKQL